MSQTPPFTLSWDGEPVLGPSTPGTKRYSSGPLVDEWRAYLRGRGMNVSSAGAWDTTLSNGTRAFQDEVGITADGLVGGDTRSAAKSRGFRVGGVVPTAVAATGLLTTESILVEPRTSPSGAVAGAGAAPGTVAPGSPPPTIAPIPFLDVALWRGAPVTRGQALGGLVTLTGGFLVLRGLLSQPVAGHAALRPDYSGTGCGCGS